jgi:hypothetical protein
VCTAITGQPSWLFQNRPDWLPFKSALTLELARLITQATPPANK